MTQAMFDNNEFYAGDWVSSAPFAAILIDKSFHVLAQSKTADMLVRNCEISTFREFLGKVSQSGVPLQQTLSFEGENSVVFFDLTVCPTREGYLVFAKDSSLEHNLRAALMDSRQRFKDLVEISSDFAWEVDKKGQFIFVSQRGAVGYDPDELIQKNCNDIVLKRDRKKALNPFMSKTRLEHEEVWVIRPEGEPACLMVSCVPLFNEDNEWVGARGVCRDITGERERDAALARAYHRDQLLAYIVKTIRDEVKPENMLSAAANATARALSANGCQIYRFRQGSGLVADSTFGTIPDEIEDLFEKLENLGENEVGFYQKKGWLAIYSATRYRQTVNGAICLWREDVRGAWNDDDKILAIDVANQLGIANEQITGHEKIVELSRTDALTGLLNRRAFFEEELPRHIDRLKYKNAPAALIYVDLDHFKLVNDVHGHQKGDEVLRILRDFLLKHVRPGDAVARLGGDEFAMWLDDITFETAYNRCERIIKESEMFREHSGVPEKPLGISVGLAMFDPASDETVESMINRSDAAMYEAKRGGRGKFTVAPEYDPDAPKEVNKSTN